MNATARLILLLTIFLSSCVPFGVSDLSTEGGKIAIVKDRDLYVVSNSELPILFYAFRPDVRFEPVLTPDGTAVVFVDSAHRLVRQPLAGGAAKVLLTQVGQPGPGALAILPNGHLFLLDTGFSSDRYIKIVNTETGETTQHIRGISHVFVTANALKLKPSDSPATPYIAARIEAAQAGQLRIVLVPTTCLLADRTCFYLYSGEASGFVLNEQLPRSLSTEMQLLLARRVENDVTSGLLTADGRYLIMRVRVPFNITTGLVALDLMTNDPPITILESAPTRPNYALSPEGHWIAYEESSNGQTQIQLLNLSTGERASLGAGTLDPQWWK